MKENKLFKRLLIFAIAAFMSLSTVSIVSAAMGDTCPEAEVLPGPGMYFCRGTPDYWYSYTPASDAIITITSAVMGQDTAGWIYDTRVYVYDACGGLLVASDDDSGGSGTSTCSFSATGGIAYKIMWDDYWGPLDFFWDLSEIGPSPGDNCGDPIVINVPGALDYYDLGQTTCGRADDYWNTCLGYYDGGEDIIYELNVASDTTVIITMDPKGTTYTGVCIDDTCPPGDPCIAYDTYYWGDGSVPLGFQVDLYASVGSYYIMVDTWPSPNCIPDFDLSIIEITAEDIGATDVIHPTIGDGPGAVTPEVEVSDFLGPGSSSADVDIDIYYGSLGAECLALEDFEGSFPPAGWSIVNNGGNCVWQRNDAWPRTNYCNGMYSACADSDRCGSGTSMDTELITPTFSLAGTTTPVLEFECAYNYIGCDYAEVDISTNGGSTWTNLKTYTSDVGAYGSVLETIPLSAYAGQTNCKVRFHYVSIACWAWWWEVDDVHVYQPGAVTPEYSDSVSGVSVPAGGSTTVTFSSWTPANTGFYSVVSCATSALDIDNTNDCMQVQNILIGDIDAGVSNIVIPHALMGPAPWNPTVEVTNYGDIDGLSIPVHCAIDDSGTVNPVFYEDFEGSMAFNTYEDVKVINDVDLHVEADVDNPAMVGNGRVLWEGASGVSEDCWTMLDIDGDGTTWHQSTNRALSPTHSMYNGDESIYEYLPNSMDMLISPRIHVGASGTWTLRFYMDIEGGSWDNFYFGTSADGVSFSWYWFGPNPPYGGWWQCTVPVNNIDACGNTYIGFYFWSDSSYQYEGIYLDNIEANGETIYAEDLSVTVDAGQTETVVFPLFTPPAQAGYDICACTEHCYDEDTTNDCQCMGFSTDAPVYILETGFGYPTIQDGIDDAEDGQTVVATDGTYNEDIVIDKPITVTGENIDSTKDATSCTWKHNHGSIIHGTVTIQDVGGSGGGPGPGPQWDMIEDFEAGSGWPWAPWNAATYVGDIPDDGSDLSGFGATEGVTTDSAHDGNYGFSTTGTGPQWFYRTDISIGNPGDKLSWWNRFTPSADGRSYLGFGATSGGCYSFVLAPNTNELKLYDDAGWGYSNLYSTSQTFIANHWYRAEVVFDTATQVTCNLYDSDGTTLLNSFTYNGISGIPGGVAFRGYGVSPNYVHIDTIEGFDASMSNGGGDYDVIFQNFDVNPLTTFVTDGAAIFVVNSSKVLVQQNTVHNVNGMVDSTTGSFTISGIKVADYDGGTSSDITVQNNTVRAILNENMTGGGGGGTTVYFEDFDAYLDGYDFDGTVNCGFWDQLNYGVACGSTYHYAEVENYKSHSAPNSAEIYYNCPNDDWLVSPAINLAGSVNTELNFWYLWDDSWDIEFSVYVEDVTNPGVWNFLAYYSLPGTSPETWYEDTLNLGAYDGDTIRVAFRYTSDNEWACYIDDVHVTSNPTATGPAYGGANAIMVQGYLDTVDVLNNRMEDVHSAGWCYGVEITPTASGRFGGSFAPVDFYTEDFSTCPGGWTTTDPSGDGTWGCDTVQPSWIITPMGPVAGNFMMIDDDANDGNNNDEKLISPVINCGSYENIMLDFDGCFNSVFTGSAGYDFLNVEVYDGSTWHQLDYYAGGPHTFEDDIGFGAVPAFDISAYADENPDVQIRFVFGDAGYWAWGAIIDNVKLTGDETGGGPGPGGNPAPQNVLVACNCLVEVGDGSVYDVWNDICAAPYPGVMLTIDETAPGADDGDATNVTVICNYFDPDCHALIYAIINKDTDGLLNAQYNFYGAPNGPGGGVQDPITGYVAAGYGSDIAGGLVHFDPWLGVHAEATASSVNVKTGEAINFDAEGSFAFCFDGCEDCCDPDAQHIQYLWDFDDGTLSANKAPVHAYAQEGTYHVFVMIDTAGFVYWPNFMYEWAYIDVVVTDPGAPFAANADGGNLGGYEGSVGEPIQLYGSASGGQLPYQYRWDLGNGETAKEQNPIALYKEPGTYTVTLTVVSGGEIATDTAEVTVYDVDELVVNIGGNTQIAQGDAVDFTSSVSGGEAPYSYSWNFGDGIVSTEANPTHVYENSGTYTVTLTVTDSADNQDTSTKTVNVGQTDTSEVEITNVDGGLLLRATINSEEPVDWSIDVDGIVLFGGHASGTTQSDVETVKLPFTLGLGSVDITITAGSVQEHYTATMIGPFVLRLQEA